MENKWLFLKFYGDQIAILEFLTYWVSGTTLDEYLKKTPGNV